MRPFSPRRAATVLALLATAQALTAAPARPVLSFVMATIGDSARVVQQRAFDVLLRDALAATPCLSYVDVARRDSVARLWARETRPFTFAAMARECGVTHGAYFSLDRYGFAVRLAARVVDARGVVYEGSDIDMLLARDTLEGANAFEGALRRLLGRFVRTLAARLDSTCPVPRDSTFALTVGGVVITRYDRGLNAFLSDNAARVADLCTARIADTLRQDSRLLVVDVYSRDRLYSLLREYDIQNTQTPTTPEVAVMHGAGIRAYVVATIDSADAFRKVGVRVAVYATAPGADAPVVEVTRTVGPQLDALYDAINAAAVEAVTKAAAALCGWRVEEQE